MDLQDYSKKQTTLQPEGYLYATVSLVIFLD